jgi:hypothetical protein
MIIDLKILITEDDDDESFVEFSFEKPVDFATFCRKWKIDTDKFYDFEYYLAEQFHLVVLKSMSIKSIYSALKKLDIPVDIPLQIRLVKTTDSCSLNLNLIKSKVEVVKEEENDGYMPF